MGGNRTLIAGVARALGVLLVCATALGLASVAASSEAGKTTAAGTCQSGDIAVSIAGNAFDPAIANINVGETVCWTNNDPVGHTVTSNSGLFDSGVLAPGEQFRFTFTSQGSYGYFCGLHPNMLGTVNAGGP